jgi:hypothetical protein
MRIRLDRQIQGRGGENQNRIAFCESRHTNMVQAQIESFCRAERYPGNISLTRAHSESTSGTRHDLFNEYCPRRIKAGPLLVRHGIWEIEGIPKERCRRRKSQ